MPTVDELLRQAEAQRRQDGPPLVPDSTNLAQAQGLYGGADPFEQQRHGAYFKMVEQRIQALLAQEQAASRALTPKGASADPWSSAFAPPGYPYFCLHCRTLETYDPVPQHNGQAMLPWHEHDGRHVLLTRISPDQAREVLRDPTTRVKHPATARPASRPSAKNVTPLPNPAAERLAAVLAKVREEGW
jgi:hypothetical protein